ncbi:unnamed protein product [Pleuronectes platessa]|uniref:Uncharacterized protein n=1 Tax=Pleuronectes platessa TaxID=8262 RepID=A0A9N7YUQ7_PLEPL|nr:unnamed protein product [Pleuronectes platessa]
MERLQTELPDQNVVGGAKFVWHPGYTKTGAPEETGSGRRVLYIPVMTRLSRRTCTNQLRALSALAVLRVIASSSSSHGALSRPVYHHPEDLTELSAVLSTTTLKISRSSQRSCLPPR